MPPNPLIRPPVYLAGPLTLDGDGLADLRLLALARLAVADRLAPSFLAASTNLVLGPPLEDDRGRRAVLADLLRSSAYLVGNSVLGELWLLEADDGDLGVARYALEGFTRAGRGRVTRRGTWASYAQAFNRDPDLAALHGLLLERPRDQVPA